MQLVTRSMAAVFVSFALLLTGPATGAAQQQGGAAGATPPENTDFVFIDSQQILEEAPGATEAQQTWSRELQQYRGEVQQLAAQVDSMQSSLEQQRDMLNQAAVERRREEIAQKRQELQRRAQELEQRAAQRQQELLGPILDQVRSVIEEIRAEQGYKMVFDASAAGVLAADPSLDVTDLVIRRLQERQASGQDSSSGGS